MSGHVSCKVLANSVSLAIMLRPRQGRDLSRTLCSQDADAVGRACLQMPRVWVLIRNSSQVFALLSRHQQRLLTLSLTPSCGTPLSYTSVQEAGCRPPTETRTQPMSVQRVSLGLGTKTQLGELK